MFDLFAPSHLLLIGIAALVFIGPKDLPRVMHMVGKWTGKARRLAGEFREGLENIEQQGQLEELRQEIAALREARQAEKELPLSITKDSVEEHCQVIAPVTAAAA